jgi:hypothetical protein
MATWDIIDTWEREVAVVQHGLKGVIRKVTLSLGPLSSPIPSFSGICKGKTFLLNLSMKCWNSGFSARGLRLIIVVVQLGAAKIYVAASRGAQEKGKTGWNSVYHQNRCFFFSFIPRDWMLMYFFAGFCWISPCVWPNSGFWCYFFLTLWKTIMYPPNKLGNFCTVF